MAIPTPVDLHRLRNVPPRKTRGNAPVVSDTLPVKCRGEDLHPVWWQGRQWSVTAYGIEARDGTYTIAADRLDEGADEHADLGWPAHICEKDWVDTEDFCTAWLVALAMHGTTLKPGTIRAVLGRAAVHAPKQDAGGGILTIDELPDE